MSLDHPRRNTPPYRKTALLIGLALVAGVAIAAQGPSVAQSAAEGTRLSDHFDGALFFNPEGEAAPPPGSPPRRSRFGWIWRWVFGNDRPEWPPLPALPPAAPPLARVPAGSLTITPVGHATFLIQMDGLNILTDPIWSDRCSPVSWAGPKRHQPPGIPFEALPPIDLVLVSHNHYDHLDLPTLERLAARGVRQAATPLGNGELLRGAGVEAVDELDWWQSLSLPEGVTITLVPARHFSSRSFWDRNETLWGGFVISGPSGNVFFAGDTGYGPHFGRIARRFGPIRAALLPISPFRPPQAGESVIGFSEVHMGPEQAIQAHLDLAAGISIAAHFQVFQLGFDGFEDAVNLLRAELERRRLKPEPFLTPPPGQRVELSGRPAPAASVVRQSPAPPEPACDRRNGSCRQPHDGQVAAESFLTRADRRWCSAAGGEPQPSGVP